MIGTNEDDPNGKSKAKQRIERNANFVQGLAVKFGCMEPVASGKKKSKNRRPDYDNMYARSSSSDSSIAKDLETYKCTNTGKGVMIAAGATTAFVLAQQAVDYKMKGGKNYKSKGCGNMFNTCVKGGEALYYYGNEAAREYNKYKDHNHHDRNHHASYGGRAVDFDKSPQHGHGQWY